MERIILEADSLTKKYERRGRNRKGDPFYALNDVSFQLRQGEILGVLGESGCGKTTLARCLVGACSYTGNLLYDGRRLNLTSHAEKADWRRKIQLVFQDSYSAFDCKRTIGYSLKEALSLRTSVAGPDASLLLSVLDSVGLSGGVLSRFPGELSGGQCQRLNIARALLLAPEILILDEPVSALDTTIQMQLLKLLIKLRKERQLTYIFISHDLPVVHYLCDRVLVLNHGKVVESGDARKVLEFPQQPYTQSLLDAIPMSAPK